MARTINAAAYEARRTAILDAAQRAVESTGYEQMAIADLLSELDISSGAFYHYFASKPALLFALVERMGDQIEQLVLPIVHDSTLGALDKLRRLFATLNQEKSDRKRFVLAYLRVWYADENAIVRHRLYLARIKRFAPWLEEITREGAREGVFTTPYPGSGAASVEASQACRGGSMCRPAVAAPRAAPAPGMVDRQALRRRQRSRSNLARP